MKYTDIMFHVVNLGIKFSFSPGAVRVLHLLLQNGCNPNNAILLPLRVLWRRHGLTVWAEDRYGTGLSRWKCMVSVPDQPVSMSCWASLFT